MKMNNCFVDLLDSFDLSCAIQSYSRGSVEVKVWRVVSPHDVVPCALSKSWGSPQSPLQQVHIELRHRENRHSHVSLAFGVTANSLYWRVRVSYGGNGAEQLIVDNSENFRVIVKSSISLRKELRNGVSSRCFQEWWQTLSHPFGFCSWHCFVPFISPWAFIPWILAWFCTVSGPKYIKRATALSTHTIFVSHQIK